MVKTLQSISEANVVLLLLDAQQDISEQDAHIAGFILESGRALVVGVNKWDGLTSDRRDEIKMDLERKLSFLSFAKTHFVSALKSSGIGPMMKSVDGAYAAAMSNLSTPKLTRALIEAVEHQQPRRKGLYSSEIALCASGRHEPADCCHSRQCTGSDRRKLQTLPGKAFPRNFFAGWDSTTYRVTFR